jgi:hypothetical protein
VALGVVMLLVVANLLTRPAFGVATTLLLLGCTVVVWMRPVAAFIILPALLPALDLAPWTGRFFFDEFDLLVAACLAVVALRTRPPPGHRRLHGAWPMAFALLAASLAISSVVGAMPWPWPAVNDFYSYFSPYNGLRIAKGAVWAGFFAALLRRVDRSGGDARGAVAMGMTLGLAYVVAFVVWERFAFAGLFDFAGDYRVTGPFSAMHRGGAFIECYLALAIPFAALRVLETRRAVVRWAGAVLLLGASYAVMVTFSRNGYAAFACAVALFFLLSITRANLSGRQALSAGLLAASMLGAAVPILLGSFAQERLARWSQDLAVRQAHWSDALGMRDHDAVTAAFGMGLGRFPESHYWRSREPVHAAAYRLERDGGDSYLRLAGGAGTLYIDQIVSLERATTAVLSVRWRANRAAAPVTVSLCEKWMLTSRACVATTLQAGSQPGAWTSAETTLDTGPLAQGRGAWARSVKLSLHTPADGTVIDVAQVALRTPEGGERLSNADFRHGLDRWFFSTDTDPPWHIHSLPIAVLFDQGWFGVAAWALLLAVALHNGLRQAWRGDRHAAAALAALVAFLVSGTLNTLIDEPRFLWLILVLAALCCARRRAEAASREKAVMRPASPLRGPDPGRGLADA